MRKKIPSWKLKWWKVEGFFLDLYMVFLVDMGYRSRCCKKLREEDHWGRLACIGCGRRH